MILTALAVRWESRKLEPHNERRDMANWYGIPDIEFHFGGPINDSMITYDGITDYSGVVVEETMWERFTTDDYGIPIEHDESLFDQYMRDNADEVRYLIELAREG